MNKKQLYESIMKNVAREVKKALNESNDTIDTPVNHFNEIVEDFLQDGECTGHIIKCKKSIGLNNTKFTDATWSHFGTPVLKYFDRAENYTKLRLAKDEELVCIIREGLQTHKTILYLCVEPDEWYFIYEEELPESFDELFEIIETYNED